MRQSLWKHEESTTKHGVQELVYRSNLLGSDRSIANWGGGNTSMKTIETDFFGKQQEVMWVKGSGSDLATMGAEHFTALQLAPIQPLVAKDTMSDDEMVEYLTHCMVNHQHPRASIETLLHAFLPYKHVDHTHPDAIISICCADNGQAIAQEIFGETFVWVPYLRPGFELSKLIAEGVQSNPHAELVLMEKHGLVTWGDTSEECYNKTLAVITQAEDYIASRQHAQSVFGGEKFTSLPAKERKAILSSILPTVRGAVSDVTPMLLTYDDTSTVLTFVNSYDAEQLSQVGAACPDHLVHTKRTPLFIPYTPSQDSLEDLTNMLQTKIAAYKEAYAAYFHRHGQREDVMNDPSPRVILIPGIGMITTGKNTSMAKVSRDLYHRAIEVMRGSTTLGHFQSLNENESFHVEYWPLELYKLSLAPREDEFSRQVAFITGGAGGIGRATCYKIVRAGGNVVIADLNEEGAHALAQKINEEFGLGRAFAVKMDVTREDDVQNAYQQAILHYGGIDIVVNNAGLATSNPFDQTTLDEWNLNMNVLTTGYFLVAREGFKVMKQQGTGGNMVFIGSKNSIYAGKNAAAYSTAKAAEVHLARCIAAEGGQYGIRVNSVLPDAVLQGSAIWNSSWREERASAYGIEPEQLEEHYRKRTTLLVTINPDDIADAILFLPPKRLKKQQDV